MNSDQELPFVKSLTLYLKECFSNFVTCTDLHRIHLQVGAELLSFIVNVNSSSSLYLTQENPHCSELPFATNMSTGHKITL